MRASEIEGTRDLFLSHSSSNKPLVRKIAADVQAHERADGGRGLPSGASSSGWTDAEWHAVLHADPDNRRGRILPALIADCPKIPPLLRHLRIIDMHEPRYEEGLREILSILRDEPQPSATIYKGQLRLFPDSGTTVGVEDEEPVHQNLRRAIKADSMKFGMPTQLVWPRTLELVARTVTAGERQVQDIATRGWNLLTALYYKAGGSPWRLAQVDPGVCFVGVSFYREILVAEPRLRTALAQMFTASGDGYVIRGKAFEWDEAAGGRSPHLDQANAASLMREVFALYKRQNEDRLPSRLVLHKSSRFTEEELRGFRDGASSVPRMDLVAFGWRGIQFHRPGLYPPLRGMYVRFDDRNFLLYTVGYVSYLRTYPGAATPQPIEILEHHGDSPWDVVLNETLGLTKMNWNTADFSCAKPMTLAFAQRVGHILAEMREGETPRPEYRYYM